MSDAERKRANAKASSARYPDRRRAREKVKDAIRRGDLKPARELACFDCGKQAARYDHYAGYDLPLKVQAVCAPCDGKRSKSRGEHKAKFRRRSVGRKVTDEQVAKIRAEYKPGVVTLVLLAKKFCISCSQVWNIVSKQQRI